MLVLIVIIVRVNVVSIEIKIFKHGGVGVEVYPHILRLTRKTHRTQLTVYSRSKIYPRDGRMHSWMKEVDAGRGLEESLRAPHTPCPLRALGIHPLLPATEKQQHV